MAFENVEFSSSPYDTYKFMLANMMARVEQRCMAALRRTPYGVMTNEMLVDPYAIFSQADAMLWLELFEEAKKINPNGNDIYARLFYIRGGGTILKEHEQFGYRLEQVIGINGWPNLEFYKKEVAYLNDYGQQIINLLKELRRQQEATR